MADLAQSPHRNQKIIYFSRFHNNPYSNGGDRRTAQLCDALCHVSYEFVALTDLSHPHKDNIKNVMSNLPDFIQEKLMLYLKQQVTRNNYLKWSERFREHLVKSNTLSKVFVASLVVNKPGLIIIDDPVFFEPVVNYAKENKVPLVAFCHNIESLSRTQVSNSTQLELVSYELDLIGKCDLVITISKEETFLLNNLGMNTVYLPYYPHTNTITNLRQIRIKRQQSHKSDFLLLGSATNLATLEGMRQVISSVISSRILQDDSLIIAGYGTGEIAINGCDPRIQVRGDLSEDELHGLLATVKGCIIYQETGAGALTKIPELLAAGVPVISNSHAARSHYYLPGIFEFENLETIGEQIQVASACMIFPETLVPPDTKQMVTRILDLIN